MKILRLLLTSSIIAFAGCASMPPSLPPSTPTSTPTLTPASAISAGFRFSTYGPSYNPGTEYWASVGEQMSARFPQSVPSAIWIVGNFTGRGTYLSFPVETNDPNVAFAYVDMNEQALNLFDKNGFKVWLQVEPGNPDMVGLIHLVMNQYSHHTCVIGFGVDVEWYKSDGSPEGTPVTDEDAAVWVNAVRSHGEQYLIFLKHWDFTWLPPTYREGLVFVDDSQQFDSIAHMLREFTGWGKHFASAPVAFQIGYPDDKHWWSELQDPPGDIGKAIFENVPNTVGVYWVDFTILDVFPPK
jgi:hypothetical protein